GSTIAVNKLTKEGAVRATVIAENDNAEPPVAAVLPEFTLKSTNYSVVHVLDASASKNAVSYHWRVLDGRGDFWLQKEHKGGWHKEMTGKVVRALAPAGSQGFATYELTVADAQGRTSV
ncbi:TPA: hypothetical protein ACG0BA_004820, partial [Serratia odorifera]